jgi:hypothetical protein
VLSRLKTTMDNFCEKAPSLDGYLALVVQDYVHPREVLRDDRLDLIEKRAILCFWASDACAVESRPGFRWLPGAPGPILFDHVVSALRALDDISRKSGREPRRSPRRRPHPDVHAGA